MTTRLEAIRQRLAQYPATAAEWFAIADKHEDLRDDAVREWQELQDLRDLLALYERAKVVAKDPEWPVRHLTEAQWRAWKHLDVILSRLDTETP